MAGWHAPRRTTPGGQAWYSDAAVELVLALRLVFHLALRQAEGFSASVLRLLGQELRVPDGVGAWRRQRWHAPRLCWFRRRVSTAPTIWGAVAEQNGSAGPAVRVSSVRRLLGCGRPGVDG
jgi:hypothetical protein